MVSVSSSSSSSHSSSSSGRHHHPSQRFGGPGFHEPMLPLRDLETAAPHGHLAHRYHSPPPPPYRHGYHPSQHFGRPAFHESMLSPPPAHESAVNHLFMSRNHSPPPPPPPPSFGHHHHPQPPSHGHPQQFGGSDFHEPMFSPHPALESAAPHMLMNRKQNSPPPPPHLDYRKYLHSPQSPPHRHRHGHGHHHPHELGRRPPALETEAPHVFMDHLYRSHSPPPPPPPPPPQGHQIHSSPFHGFQHHADKFHMQPPMEPSEETLHQYEPSMSGMGPHPPHHFPGHPEGVSNWLPREEEHPPPHQVMGGGHYDHFDFHGGHSYFLQEMGGAPYAHEMGGAHRLRHPPLHPRSPPPKYRWRPVAPPSYPPFCAPLVPASHLSNAHLAVPVW